MGAAGVAAISMMIRMSSAVFDPAPLWAVFWAVVGGAGAVLVLLMRIRRALASLRDYGARVEQWAARAEERTRLEVLGHDGTRDDGIRDDGIRRATRVDGWLGPPLRCPRPEWPEGPTDGIVLRGRVMNRTRTPVWDVLAEAVDPRTGHSLPLVPLTRYVLPPGDGWPLEWICGCTVTPPESTVIDVTEDRVVHLPPSAPAQTPAKPRTVPTCDGGSAAERNPAASEDAGLPVPEVLLGVGIARPQLRITFSDASGRWVRLGGWVTPATGDRRPPPGSAAFSRASDELEEATSQNRAPDTSRIAIEVGLALHEVARRRLGRFNDSPLDLSALPALLVRHPFARRLHLEEGTVPRGAPTGPPLAETRRSLVTLALAVRSLDERIGTASGRSPSSTRLLLAHAGSVLTALNALRLAPDGSSADKSRPDASDAQRSAVSTAAGDQPA